MDKQTAEILCNLTSEFYNREASSFSQTRNHPWPGWSRCVAHLAESRAGEEASGRSQASGRGQSQSKLFRVLDMACGNMRFERFLLQEGPAVAWQFFAVDNCYSLAFNAMIDIEAEMTRDQNAASDTESLLRFVHADVMEELLRGEPLECVEGDGPFDCAVAFGFMHHIPGRENRLAFLRALLQPVRSGGVVALSFWRFMSEEKLAAKAVETTEHARRMAAEGTLAVDGAIPDTLNLEENDYLLGWRDDQDVFRYCHHFDDEELDELVAGVADKAQLIDRFQADGRTGDLNSYLVFRVL